MAQNNFGRNITFPIYNSDGSPFHGLELKKATVDSVVMSLGDKVTGDVYYIDNSLAVTMQEYIVLNGVKYTLVSPPTIVREGMVTDNTQLKGMTKYSFTFYHPMYMLGNIPFTDIAVIPAQEKYLSQNKTFSWIGTFSEFVDKLNANLASTEWLVIMSSTVTQEKQNEIPEEVLSFDKQFISNALKTGYDTWKVPFVITSIKEGETGYSQGKHFLITFGLPTQEIYTIDAQGHKTSTPFIFQFGKGVGLKNNSRTPKNNKIVTRISGYGSERNVPFGYPQIVWEGDQSWDYTINNDSSTYGSYPIYDGIVGGQRVRLIKHPFTRAHVMPPVYVKSVNRKVNPYASGYNPDTTIIDYYDATQAENYPNPINLNAPSVEIHEFEDIYPRLDNKRLISVSPYEETPEMISKSTFNTRIQAFKALSNNENEKSSLQDCYDSFDVEGVYYIEGQGGSYTFRFDIIERKDYSHGTWYHVKYTSDNINFEYIVWDGTRSPVFDVQWDDTMDDDGNYKQGYFKIKLPYLDFDLYACAAVTQEMKINMRGGLCMGCTFPIQVDWDDYKANFYDSEGNFDPQIGEGHPRDGEKYPDSSREEIDVIVKKDNETFGKLMPNTYQLPVTNDEFVILGISLPTSYITNAELELADAMKEYMLENNVHYYDYPLKFDEHFFATNTGILEQIQNNNVVRFQYAGAQMPLYIKQITIKYGDKPLPQYDITLTDDVEIVLNQIGQVTDDVSRMRAQVSELQKYYSENLIQEINSKLSKIVDDVCQGRITFQQGLNAIGSVIFSDEIRSQQFETGLYTGRGWRIDQLGNAELESLKVRSYLEVVELIINRLQAQEGDTLFTDNDQIDKVDMVVNENDNSVSYVLSLKEKYQGYVTGQMYGNVVKGIINTLAAKQAGVSDVQDSQTVEIDGSNTYYTSWMQVIGTHNTNVNLGVNQIQVVLYGDNFVPAGRNFAPCELMTIARWGCVDYSDPQDPNYETIKASITRRQRMFMISTTEGRVVKYTGVDSPILRNGNYGVTIGELPEFVKNYSDVRAILNQVGEHTDWLYAQGVVVGKFIKVDIEGNPEPNIIDCGNWVNGANIVSPTPRNGVYLYNEWNSQTQQYETHDVWHNNAKWRCKMTQPVISAGVAHYYEPTDANPAYWQKLEQGLSGGETIMQYALSSYKTSRDGTAQTPPADISSSDWQDSPMAITSQKPYLWAKVQKKDGNGNNIGSPSYIRLTGEGGVSITSADIVFGLSTSETTAPSPDNTTTWKTSIAALSLKNSDKDKYIWQCTKITYSNGNTPVYTGKMCLGIVSSFADIVEQYTLGTASVATGTWQDTTPPEMANGYYLWTRTKLVYSDNSVSYTPSANGYCVGYYGIDGTSIIGANVWYALSSSNSTAPQDSAFTLDDFPTTLNAGYYVWESTKITFSSGNPIFTGKMCIGATSDFLSGTEVYAISTSNNNPPIDSKFGTTYSKTKGYYLWTATRVRYTNGNYAYLNKKCVGYWGEDGIDGQDGQDAHEINPNILLRTIFDRGIGFVKEKWEADNWSYITIDTAPDTVVQGRKSLRINANAANQGLTLKQNVLGKIKPNTWYTVSFNSFYSGGGNFYVSFYNIVGGVRTNIYDGYVIVDGVATSITEGSCNVPVNGSWNGARHFVTFKTGSASVISNSTLFFLFYQGYSNNGSQNHSISAICMPKLEEGKVATAYMAHEDDLKGDKGDSIRGKVGRFYYYAGVWNDFANNSSWKVSDVQAPYFQHTVSNQVGYYVFNPENNGEYTKQSILNTYGAPRTNAPWVKLWDDFEYIITKAIFGDYANFGSSIINGDYLLSQYGYMRGFGNTKTPIANNTQYIYADPDDMFGEKEWDLTHDENIIVNKHLNIEITNNDSYSKIESISAFEIKKDRWYTMWLTGYCYGDNNTHTLTVAIGTSSSNIITASAISVKGYNSKRSDGLYESYLTFKATANLSTCYMYVKNDSRDAYGLVYNIVMRYAQFVPTLCIDMKSGKIVANNIEARGELHADSFVYNMIYGNNNEDTITVNEESIINLGTKAVSTIVKLPSPSISKGRRIEIYNHSTEWEITWVGASSTSSLQSAYGSNLGYRTSYGLQLNYMLVYCDGTTWWCLKAE